MLKKLVLLAISISSVFAMHSAELNINKYDLEAGVDFDLGQFNHAVEPDTTFLGFGYLKAGSENASNEDVDGYVNLNFMIKQNIQGSDFKVGMGVKAVYTSYLEADFIATPIGAELSYKLPLNSAVPISVSISAFYAPESLSFSDAGRYLEYITEASFRLMERASVYVGYRKIDTKYNYNDNIYDYTYNESGYFGFRFSF